MGKTETVKKIKWNISKNIGIVTSKLKDSQLSIKPDEKYLLAMKRLKEYFSTTNDQTWVLCLTVLRYFEEDDSTIFRNLSNYIDCSSMDIISWKKDIDALIDRKLLEWNRYGRDFQPTASLRQCILENEPLTIGEEDKVDDISFLSNFKKLYESRRDRELDAELNFHDLRSMESKNARLPIIKRTRKEIPDPWSRFFLYDCCSDMVCGNGGFTGLNATICDLWDNPERLDIAKEMMNETHPLFSQGYLQFEDKGSLSDATITLTSKAKQLLLADKAFLFEEKINDRNIIDYDKIKSKELFYDEENAKQIEKLEAILSESKLNRIQKRLQEDGMPKGIAILLYGAPGTGKTETVYQLAKKTKRSIYHVDISDTKSAWFGESEKLIKKVFTGYKNMCRLMKNKGEKIPILLFNEADAILSKRTDSRSSNVAQTENAIQNIILEEMENLEGIMIATTNLASNFDGAFERRFLFKMKFDNPSLEAKKKIWHSKLDWISDEDLNTVAESFDFSGGQIDNIVRKVTMNEIISGKKTTLEELKQFCKTEKLINSSDKHIGFLK